MSNSKRQLHSLLLQLFIVTSIKETTLVILFQTKSLSFLCGFEYSSKSICRLLSWISTNTLNSLSLMTSDLNYTLTLPIQNRIIFLFFLNILPQLMSSTPQGTDRQKEKICLISFSTFKPSRCRTVIASKSIGYLLHIDLQSNHHLLNTYLTYTKSTH